MVIPTQLPKTLQIYVDHIAAADRPLDFSEIVAATPGVNQFRFLKERGLIRDVGPPKYTGAPGEVYDGPRTSKWVLTGTGLALVTDND